MAGNLPAGLSPRNPAGDFSTQQGKDIMAGMTRYSLYYRLMDICLALQVVTLGVELTETAFDYDLVDFAGSGIPITLFLMAIIVPVFLVFARFMRDDFAEMLWQKTAGTVLKALMILPVPVAIAAGVMIAGGQIDIPTEIFTHDEVTDTDSGAIFGVVLSLIYIWIYTPVLFTLAFQWHRWRASR